MAGQSFTLCTSYLVAAAKCIYYSQHISQQASFRAEDSAGFCWFSPGEQLWIRRSSDVMHYWDEAPLISMMNFVAETQKVQLFIGVITW